MDATEREYQSDDRSEGLVSAERCLVTLETEPVRYCQLVRVYTHTGHVRFVLGSTLSRRAHHFY